MRKKKQKTLLNGRLNCRISKEELLMIKKLAKEKGMTMTALIKFRLKNLPLIDYVHQKELFSCIEKLTREMNQIGVNINQAVVALHQINQGKMQQSDEVKYFNELFQQYNDKRDELCDRLEKLLFR